MSRIRERKKLKCFPIFFAAVTNIIITISALPNNILWFPSHTQSFITSKSRDQFIFIQQKVHKTTFLKVVIATSLVKQLNLCGLWFDRTGAS